MRSNASHSTYKGKGGGVGRKGVAIVLNVKYKWNILWSRYRHGKVRSDLTVTSLL
jgi:hypothetical protein